MHHVNHPPLEPLREAVAALEGAGIRCALGGSGLLAALGLASEVHDWDLTVDAPARLVWPRFDAARLAYVGSDALHADEKVQLPADRIEIICGFAFSTAGGVARLPTVVCGRWQEVPTASPEVWAAAYALLGRATKAEALFAHLAETGARPEIVRALREQPLPADLARRLAALPRRDASSIT